MCGLVGVVGHIDNKAEKMFQNMLRLDTMRGSDSTGIFSHGFSGHNKIIKEVGTPWDLEGYKMWDVFFAGWHKVLMGHNRSATKGKVNRENAHPFEFNDVVGAHNGTLRSTHNLEDHLRFDVDSEALFNHLDKHGVEETLKIVNGAFALSWFNKKDKTFHLVRNNERPLSVCTINDGKALAYASESWMLRIGGGYAGVTLGEIKELPVATLLTIKTPEENNFNLAAAKPLEMESKVVELYTPPKIIGGGNVFEKKRAATTDTTKRTGCHGTQDGGLTAEFDVIFEIASKGKSSTGPWFLEGEIVECSCDPKRLITQVVRVHPQYLSKQWNDMFYSMKFFKGKVKHFSHIDKGYYAIDLRTIEEVDVDAMLDGKKEETCMNCGDKILNHLGFTEYPTGEKVCAFCAEDFRKHASGNL